MAFKFTKAELAERDRLVRELGESWGKVEDAVTTINKTIEDEFSELTSAIDDHNSKLGEARGFIESVVNDRREEYDNKSETWQEGDRGQAVSTWLEELEGIELEDVEAPDIPEIEIDDLGSGDTAENLASASSEAEV